MKPASRRGLGPRLALVAFLAAIPACSLLIDFDAYRADHPEADGDADPPEAAQRGDAALDADADEACEASLSDFANCGLCGRVCNEGPGSCDAGRCLSTALFDDDAAIAAVAVPLNPGAENELYFTTGEPFVGRRAIPDGPVEMAPTPAGVNARALAVTEDGAQGVAVTAGKTIGLFDAGSFGSTFGQVYDDPAAIAAVWVTVKTAFWSDHTGTWWSPISGAAGASGGSDAGEAVAFAENGGTVVWVDALGGVFSVDALAPSKVSPLLADSTQTFTGVALSGSFLYLTAKSSIGGALLVYSTGNLSTPLRKISLMEPESVVTDGASVYVIDYRGKGPNDSRLWRCNAAGTQLIILADHLRSSRALAVDAQWVYFADGPTLLRTTK